MSMNDINPRTKLVATGAIAALLAGGMGIAGGRYLLAPADPSAPTEALGAKTKPAPEGLVDMTAQRIQSAGIAVAPAELSSLSAEIIAQGVVASPPDGEAVLTAWADGVVVSIRKQLGESVQAGEVVAALESRDAAAMAAERGAAAARLSLARSAYAREKRLYEARVTARQDMEGAAATLGEAEAEMRRASSAAAAAGVARDGRRLAVMSLVSGRITKMDAKLGTYASAGTELFRVTDPRRVQVNAAVLASDARRIQPGDTATLELVTGETTAATVLAITPSVDPASRSATIVLRPGGSAGLTVGQGLRVRIKPRVDSAADRIVLPEEAVQSVEGRSVVFVRRPTGFQAITVGTGARGGGRIEILSGIRAGDLVATKGAFLLKAELGKEEAEH